MKYLLDTNILIDWFSQGAGQGFIAEKIAEEECYFMTSWICAAEFLVKAHAKEKNALFKILESGELELKSLSSLDDLHQVSDCRRITALPLPDAIILSTAKLEKATLVTCDLSLVRQGRKFYSNIFSPLST